MKKLLGIALGIITSIGGSGALGVNVPVGMSGRLAAVSAVLTPPRRAGDMG